MREQLWFGARAFLKFCFGASPAKIEERIILVRAYDYESALDIARSHFEKYANEFEHVLGGRIVVYELEGPPNQSGDEVFSIVKDASELISGEDLHFKE